MTDITPDLPGIIVIPEEDLASASAEEREAYYQYLLGSVLEADEWEPWIKMLFPSVASSPFSQGHRDFWEWVWSVEVGKRPRPWVSIWPRGHGKALDLNTRLPTPTGWTAMGAVQVGDQLLDENGNACTVTHVSDVHLKEAGIVDFTGGYRIVAALDHEWTVMDAHSRSTMYRDQGNNSIGWPTWSKPGWSAAPDKKMCSRTLTTQEISESLMIPGGLTRYRWSIPMSQPWTLPEADLPVDPYLLGIWLMHGEDDMFRITPPAKDFQDVSACLEERGIEHETYYSKVDSRWHISVKSLRQDLLDAGVTSERQVPPAYLRASEHQRRELLRGLCDSCAGRGMVMVEFASKDYRLTDTVRQLAVTLGVSCNVTEYRGAFVGRLGIPRHELLGVRRDFLTPKDTASRSTSWAYSIKSVAPIGEIPVKCVTVDSPNHLFLAGDGCVPTHNSTSAELAVVAIAARERRKYGLYISESQDQADDHVANVAALLESNSIEMAYPELGQRLVGKFGTSKGWRRNRIRTKTGFTLDAMGLDSAARGVKLEDQRPDFILLDDIDGELDTEDRVIKKMKTITRKILPAGAQDCAILMVQNLVHDDSVFAQLADGRADFLRDRFVSGPIPAIRNLEYMEGDDGLFVITAGEPTWPEGFTVEACQALMNDIGLSAFLAECQHETAPPMGDIFAHVNFRHIDLDEIPALRRSVVWVDPAVTTTDSSDSMGIQCDGLGVDNKIYRLFSWESRTTPYKAIRLAVEKALEYNAEVVGVETNQGGDLWRVVFDQVCEDIRIDRGDSYMKMPRYKEAKATADLGSKVTRAERMLVDYERGILVHVRGTHDTLERSLRRFPRVKPYDLVDSAYWAWKELADPLHRRRIKMSSSARRNLQSSVGIGGAPMSGSYN